MALKRRSDAGLLAFITLSLLLHLLIFFLLPQRDLFPVPVRPQPVVVEMRPPPPRQRELDLPPPPAPEQPRETPAKRLGPSDQIVKKEAAPPGEDPDDLRPSVPVPPPPRPQPPPTPPAAPPRPTPAPPAERPAVTEAPGPPPAADRKEAPPATKPLPDLNMLTQLPPETVARLERNLEKELRHKYRPNVDQGDAYFLDTEKDILLSFFQRFRANIYAVWSYPAKARDRMQEGVCLLKVTVNRDGTLRDVQVMESSGYPLLDEEAVAAVRKGAPFGELHSAYTEETISIFAFFQYNLTRINSRRPGNIF